MITRITWEQVTASGRRTSWARTVESLDRKERGARAFVGLYLDSEVETDLVVGSLVLEVVPTGSVKNGSQKARVYRVAPDGQLEEVLGPFDWRKQFLTLLDETEKLLTRASREEEVQQSHSEMLSEKWQRMRELAQKLSQGQS